MQLVDRLATNTFILFTATAVSGILFFAYQVVIARYLGAADYGVYSFAFAYVALFAFLIEGGLGTFVIREVSRHKESTGKFLVGSLFNKAWLFAVVLIITSAGIYFLKKDQGVKELIYLFLFAAFFENLANSFIFIFKAHEEMVYVGIYQVAKNFLLICVALFAANTGKPLKQMVLFYAAACFLALLASAALYWKKFGKIAETFDFRFSMTMMKSSLSFCLYGLLAVFYAKIDTVLLSVLRNDTEVGFYNASFRLIDMLGNVPAIFLTAVLPAMSIAHIKSHDTLRLIFKKVTQLLIIFIVPVSIGTSLLAEEIIAFIYGPGYASSVPALRVLIWAAFFYFISFPGINLLNATNKQRMNVVFISLVAAFSVSLNMLLISRHGYMGASYTMVISEVGSFALSYSFIFFYMFKVNLGALLLKPMTAGLIMGAFTLLTRSQHILVVVPLSACIYISFLLALKTFSQEDVDAFKKMFGRSR